MRKMRDAYRAVALLERAMNEGLIGWRRLDWRKYGVDSTVRREPVFTKESPHLRRRVNAAARGPHGPFRQGLAAGPGMASALNRVEHDGRVVGAVRVRAAADVHRHR